LGLEILPAERNANVLFRSIFVARETLLEHSGMRNEFHVTS
jgi:hypothetical protein